MRRLFLGAIVGLAAFAPTTVAGATGKAPAGCLAAMTDMDKINTDFLTFVTTAAGKYQALIGTALTADGTQTLELKVLATETKAITTTNTVTQAITPAEKRLKKDEARCRAGH